MILTKDGVELVKHFEGCRLTAYRDPVGILTIGYGSTGPHVYAGMTISQEEADRLLDTTLDKFSCMVRDLVPPILADHQFSALVSFSYNVGVGAFKESTLRRLLLANEYWNAAGQFSLWNKACGNVLNGLILRRAAERDMFCGFPSRWIK